MSGSSFQIYLLHHFQGLGWGWPASSFPSPLLPILEVRSDICFLPLLENFPLHCHDLSEVIKCPQTPSTSSLSSWECHPSDSRDLSGSGLFQYSLTWSFSSDRKSSLPCILQWPQVPGFLRANTTSEDWDKGWHCQLSHVLCHQVSCLGHTFSLITLWLLSYLRNLSCWSFISLCKFNFRWALPFITTHLHILTVPLNSFWDTCSFFHLLNT